MGQERCRAKPKDDLSPAKTRSKIGHHRVLKREVHKDFSFFCTRSRGRSVGGGVAELSLVGDYCYRNLLSLMDDG